MKRVLYNGAEKMSLALFHFLHDEERAL